MSRTDDLNKCIDETGKVLRECNEDIATKLCELVIQRDELVGLIEKQYVEKKQIETELEKLTYKMCLINKSLYQRLKTKSQYDRSIEEIEKHYKKIMENTTTLRTMLHKHHANLEEMMNKKTGTEENEEGEVKVLYAKKWIESVESEQNKCTCDKTPSKEPPPPVEDDTRRCPNVAEDGKCYESCPNNARKSTNAETTVNYVQVSYDRGQGRISDDSARNDSFSARNAERESVQDRIKQMAAVVNSDRPLKIFSEDDESNNGSVASGSPKRSQVSTDSEKKPRADDWGSIERNLESMETDRRTSQNARTSATTSTGTGGSGALKKERQPSLQKKILGFNSDSDEKVLPPSPPPRDLDPLAKHMRKTSFSADVFDKPIYNRDSSDSAGYGASRTSNELAYEASSVTRSSSKAQETKAEIEKKLKQYLQSKSISQAAVNQDDSNRTSLVIEDFHNEYQARKYDGSKQDL